MELYLQPNASHSWIQSDNFVSAKLNYVISPARIESVP